MSVQESHPRGKRRVTHVSGIASQCRRSGHGSGAAHNNIGHGRAAIDRDDIGDEYRSIADQHDADLHADPNWFQPLGVHARAHAVKAAQVRAGEQPAVAEGEFTDRLNRLSFSTFNQYPILQAMTTLGLIDDALMTARDNWGGQLQYGGTTDFEVFRPDWLRFLGTNDPVPNSQSGWTSLSHPWGGGVTAWISHDILGITATTPGYDTVDVFPRLGRTLAWVSGSVPTRHGDVSVAFNAHSGNGHVGVPAGTVGRVGVPSDGRAIESVRVNGQLAWDGRFHPVPGIGGASLADGAVVLTDVAAGSYDLGVSYAEAPLAAYRPEPLHYPMRFFRGDTTTAGNWGGRYGRDGYVMFNYDGSGQDRQSLPGYVQAVRPWRTGWSGSLNAIWQSNVDDQRALAPDAANGTPRTAACIYTTTPSPGGMTMPVDITVTPGTQFQLAMYFVDWDSTDRRLAVEVFDLQTRKLVAPEQLVDAFHDGAWLVYECDRSVRVRIAHILGANAVLSGLFFDPAR